MADQDTTKTEGNEGVPYMGFTPIEDDSGDIEIVSPEQLEEERKQNEGDLAGLGRDELIEKLKRIEEERQGTETKPQQTNEDLQRQIQEIQRNIQGASSSQQLEAIAQQIGQRQQQSGESEEAFRKRLSENFYDDPVGSLEAFIGRKLAPEIQRLAANNLYHSRRYLELDPEKKDLYKKYKKEIDQVVQRMPNEAKLSDPEIYEKAYKQVMSDNIDAIVEAKIKERLGTLGEQTTEEPKVTSTRPPQHSEVGGNPNPGLGRPAKRRVALTPEEKRLAEIRGVSPEQYAAWKMRNGR